MSKENEFRLEMPPQSPVVPVQLWENDTLRFRCHKGIACFNKCCGNAAQLAEQQDQMYDSLKEQGG